MSRFNFGVIDPDTKSGTQLASDLTAQENALHTSHRGAGRPSYAQAGMIWVDDTVATEWVLYLYDGTDDREVARWRPATGVFKYASMVAGDDAAPPITTEGYQLFVDTSDAEDKLLIRRGDDSQWEILGELNSTNGWTPYSQGAPITLGGAGAILGEIRMYSAVGALPAGWLECDGTVLNQVGTYADLFALIGTTWNTGGEAGGTFRLPDMRGRSPLGVGLGASLTNRNLADTGGVETHSLTAAENGPHSHAVNDPGHVHATTANLFPTGSIGGFSGNEKPGATTTGANATGISIVSSGSGAAHETMHPFSTVRFIIRAES